MTTQEIEKKLIAIELIQELIVDILDEAKVIQREDFETLLSHRVNEYNKEVDDKNDFDEYPFNLFNTPIGEA
jgi:hypothetical protein